MAKIVFPYTMHCPRCKAPLKIKSAKLLGTRIFCPKCKKNIEVVTPEEDGAIPYGVEEMPPPEPEPEPTEEELEAKELEDRKKRRELLWSRTRYTLSVLWLSALLGGFLWLCYFFIYRDMERKKAEEAQNKFGGVKVQAPK